MKKVEKTGRQNTDGTRERIIAAARKVFAQHPYHVATIRMVGKAGGFDHQLIAYYFPTKADLFEAATSEVCDDFYRASQRWFEGLSSVSVEQGFSTFVERLLRYHYENPEPLRMVALNAPMIERLEEIPGYQHIVEMLSKTRDIFRKNLPPGVDPESLDRFINTFDTAIITYLGSAPGQAEILGMNSRSKEYRTWVKETLLFVFLPVLEALILSERL